VRCARGETLLKEYKILPESHTVRMVAACCNAAMWLRFDDQKHWVDLYRARCSGAVPPLRMRICTRFAPKRERIPNDVPCFPGYPARFLLRLLWAKFLMMNARR
jgi:hypothetical protein